MDEIKKKKVERPIRVNSVEDLPKLIESGEYT